MTELQNSSYISEININNKAELQTSKDLQAKLEQAANQMTNFQKTGEFIKASRCKSQIKNLKAQIQQKFMEQILYRHKKQKKRLLKSNQKQSNQLIAKLEQRKNQTAAQCEKWKTELKNRHIEQIQAAQKQIDQQTPIKMKESAELLNLKRIMEQLVKQKQYIEAHKVQQQTIELQKKQKQIFEKQRIVKVQNALIIVKNKQKTQKQALMRKIKRNQNQLAKDIENQVQKIKLKFANLQKQLKTIQEKEILIQKGQFKSKTRLLSSPQKARSFLYKSL